jgi:proteasome accessory factor C
MSETPDKPVVHAAREQVARLLALVPYLHSRGEVRLSDAAAALGVEPDQLDKDLRVLFMCGLPGGYPDDLINVDLDALEGDRIIRVDNADYLARPVSFAPSEAAALVVALRALAQSAAPETQEVVRRTLAKFEAAGQTAAAERVHVEATPEPGSELVPVLQDAIDRGHQLELDYHVASRDEHTRRVVEPRALTRVGDATYLDAWCHTAGGDRVFRLDRILAATDLGTPVSEQAGSARDLGSGWFEGEGSATTVTVRLAPAAHWVTEYHPVTDVRPGPDGTLDVDLEVASEAWLRQLLFRVAPHASVVAPPEFADSFTASARAAVRLYADRGVR